jgi:hypothetical protein
MCQVMRLTIYYKFYDDISMLFHSPTFIILCGSDFSSILQHSMHPTVRFLKLLLLNEVQLTGFYSKSDIVDE